MPVKIRSGLWLPVLATLMMSACEIPVRPDARPDPDQLEAMARSEVASGDYLTAARHFDQLAALKTGTARAGFRLEAAEQWYQGGRPKRARTSLDAAGGDLPVAVAQSRIILYARLDILDGSAQQALNRLRALGRPASSQLAAEILNVRADALFELGDVAEAVRALVEREIWLADAPSIIDNHASIWAGMAAAGANGSAIVIPDDAEPILSAWLLLGQIGAESERNPFVFKTRLIEWRRENPYHPASSEFVDRLLVEYRAELGYPQQVALLLPLSGRQRGAAVALRDGFLAARFEHSGDSEVPAVHLYDTVEFGAAEAYRRAAIDGADFVVGPLTKDEVAAVARVARGHIPTLALNFLSDQVTPPPAFFQFSLAPEDEARQVADRVIADGHTRGIALVPDNEWGLRQLKSFGDSLRGNGGTLLAFKVYDTRSRDVSGPVTDLLHINYSNTRQKRLASDLGAGLDYDPRQRGDAEFIFLAGQPSQGRMIKPLLELHYAPESPVPVYSTSSIYQEDSAHNSDLNGIAFVDIPWLLTPDPTAAAIRDIIGRYWPARADRRSRLYAMGFDAYRLVPLLHNSEIGSGRPVSGMTGELSIDSGQRIHRRLVWAKFERGVPVIIPSETTVVFDVLEPE